MKTIIHADAVASRICGLQKTVPDAELRKSRFCVTLPCEGGTLLYHTLTGELRLLSRDENEEQYRQELATAWFLVPPGWDEVRYARQLRRILAAVSMQGKKKHEFVILSTTDCNARCYYCFERGVEPKSMDTGTARAVGKYIARCCGEEVSIHWFGGEPLYNISAIETICETLRERGVNYFSRMTSNAYYLDNETAICAKKSWHLQQIQITLDGTEKVYNRIKAYRDRDDNPFERVMRNIDGALDAGIRVILRLNMDAGNADDLFVLADDLGRRFQGRQGLYAVVVILKEVAGKIRRFSSEQEALERKIALSEKLQGFGFGLDPETAPLNGKLCVNKCNADNDASEVILPDGGIAKCEHVNCAGTVGSIFSEERDEKEILAWKEPAQFPECEECALLPRCGVLKRCEWVKNGCMENMRVSGIRALEKQILEAYRKSIADTEEGI